MSRTLKIYIFFLLVLIAFFIYIDAIRPKPIDWKPSYDLRDKIPFGLYVFDKESSTILSSNKIKKESKTVNVGVTPDAEIISPAKLIVSKSAIMTSFLIGKIFGNTASFYNMEF